MIKMLQMDFWIIQCMTVVLSLTSVNTQLAEKLTVQNTCLSKPNCHECIQTPSCAWCYAPRFQGTRCFQPSYPIPLSGQCPEEYTYNPDNLYMMIMNKTLSKAHAFVDGKVGGGGHAASSFESSGFGHYGESGYYSGQGYQEAHQEIVQVQPQRISLELRARQSYSIYMNYTQAVDYPVDLYYLMDLSKSMEDDKDKLSLLGDLLANTMKNITSNFRLGFGSFVDKVVMPYVSTVPKKLKMPCQNCEAPYGFRNHLQLSTNTSQFSQMVKAASVSGNLDAPEGGFDAIMQAIVCNNEIGWRSKARRLLVFSTDAGFHYAGDGKLGGIIKPNDGECHLDGKGLYTHSTLQDYPSISQINLKVKKHAINVIFAVTADQKYVYEKLQENIEGSSSGTLSGDSSNIVELIKTQYEQISSQIQLSDNATKDIISINYYTKCLNKTGVEKKTRKCENVKVGDLIEFRIEIEVLQCPKDPKDWNQVIKIYPVAINESLIIDLKLLCSCPCERPGDPDYKENSEECSYNGIYKCGICECAPQRFGRMCECSLNHTDGLNNTIGCRRENASQDCSGRGSCVCGVCECYIREKQEEKIYGDYCECDNFSCERHDGLLCSGPSHGICDCGLCKCKNEWTGPNCACKKSNETCYDSKTGLLCSGHGTCECGKCKCDSTEEGRYSGDFCEKCLTCADRCDEHKECVQCQMYGTGKLSKEECSSCNFTPTAVDVVTSDENNENLCAYYDEEDCRFTYVYFYDANDTIQVRAQQERECPPKVFLLGIVLGVIAVIVLMGLAVLLLWKLFTTIHDRREFAKFEKERMMAKWDTGENPIYKQATSTFKNPTYAGKS